MYNLHVRLERDKIWVKRVANSIKFAIIKFTIV